MQTDFKAFLNEYSVPMNQYLKTTMNPGIHPDMNRYLYHPLAVFSANAGKRHRPLICLIGSLAVGGNIENAKSAAAAVEHFHTAALIHDDIADESTLRRGKPAMHLVEGEGIAINAADLALSLVTGSIIEDMNLDDTTKIKVLRLLVHMTTRTIEGQALDVGWARDNRFDLTVEDYFVMAEHKTAFYSGAIPLACGAVIGGGTDEQVDTLREFGMITGLAFQIQDDILNLVGTEEAKEKDFQSDITEGKRTLIAVHALANSKDAEELKVLLSEKTEDPKKLARAVEIMQEAGSIEFAREHSFDQVKRAKELLVGKDYDPECIELLNSMADFFVERLS